MRRRIFIILSVLSLLLALAIAGLWVRSYLVVDVLLWRGFKAINNDGEWTNWYVRSLRGDLFFFYDINTFPASEFRVAPSQAHQLLRRETGFYHWRVGVSAFNANHAPPSRGVTLPLWPFMVAALVACSLFGWGTRRESQRLAYGLCPKCGYDLRASKDKCPECGTAI